MKCVINVELNLTFGKLKMILEDMYHSNQISLSNHAKEDPDTWTLQDFNNHLRLLVEFHGVHDLFSSLKDSENYGDAPRVKLIETASRLLREHNEG